MQEKELIAKAQEGDTSCFEQLVFQYQDRLYQFLLARCKNSHDAEDCLQNTFVNAFRYINSYQSKWAFSTWLFTIAHRQLSSKDKKLYVVDATLPDASYEDTLGAESNELWSLAKRHLSAKHFELLWFYYVEEFDLTTIANIVNQSTTWAKTNLYRARKQLEQHILEKLNDEKNTLEFEDVFVDNNQVLR